MTEEEWLACAHPIEMLQSLKAGVSDRKSRLFRCAICRHVWEYLSQIDQEVIEVAEEYADGAVTEAGRTEAMRCVVVTSGGQVAGDDHTGGGIFSLYDFNSTHIAVVTALATDSDFLICQHTGRVLYVYRLVGGLVWDRTEMCVESSAYAVASLDQQRRSQARGPFGRMWNALIDVATNWERGQLDRTANRIHREEMALQAQLLRDIFGNPYRPVSFDPAWRTSTAVAIAQGMYESRDFGAMPILADALQDAGCDDDAVLAHCRDPQQVHVRGCWVVDLVLGKG